MYLQESEITTKKIKDIFSGAFLDVEEINEDGFSIKGPDSVISTRIFNQLERKIIHFRHTIEIYRISEQGAAIICNEINTTSNMVKLSAFTYDSGEITITSTYQMTYEKGLIPFQVMSNYRFFEKIVPHVLRTHFSEYL